MKKILIITALASLSACGGSSGSDGGNSQALGSSNSGGSNGNSQVLGTSPISLQNRKFKVSQSDFVTDCPRPARSLFTNTDPAQLYQTGVYREEIHAHGNLLLIACCKSFRDTHEHSHFSFADNTYSITVGSNKDPIPTFYYKTKATVSDKATFDAALQSANVMNYTQKLNSRFELIEKSLVKQDQNKHIEYQYNAVDNQYTQSGIEAMDSSKIKLENGVLINKGEGAEFRIYKIQ